MRIYKLYNYARNETTIERTNRNNLRNDFFSRVSRTTIAILHDNAETARFLFFVFIHAENEKLFQKYWKNFFNVLEGRDMNGVLLLALLRNLLFVVALQSPLFVNITSNTNFLFLYVCDKDIRMQTTKCI